MWKVIFVTLVTKSENVKKYSFCVQWKWSYYEIKIYCYNIKMFYVLSIYQGDHKVNTYRRYAKDNEKEIKAHHYKINRTQMKAWRV